MRDDTCVHANVDMDHVTYSILFSMYISMDTLYVTEHDCEHNGSNMSLSIGYS